jgi:hypothetical protein
VTVTTAIARPPYARAALAYGLGLALTEFVVLAISARLFRAVLVADAATGWLVVAAAFQGLRAVPAPPPVKWVAASSLAAGHWLAVLFWLVTLR